jgi:DHA1 family tetracycline resistance protein-like MFS transporter
MSQPTKSTNHLIFIFITILIDSIGIGIVFPVMPDLLMNMMHINETEATQWGGYLATAYALMQFVFAPVLGGISDRYGRRPVLLLSLVGLGLDYIFLTFANTITLLFIGRIVAGICGGSFTTGFAYIADVVPAEKRAQSYGLMGAAFGLGFILGPVIGGILGEIGGERLPFIAAAVITLLNFLYGYFILPESLKPEHRRAFDIKRANPFGAYLHLSKIKELRLLVLGMFFLYLAGQVMPAVWPYYTKILFGWGKFENGMSLAFVGLVVAGVQGGLIRFAHKKFGQDRSILIGLFFYAIGLFLFASADQPWMMYVYTLVYALGGIGPPAIQALISSRTAANEQGEIQGLLTSLTSLAAVLSPLMFTQILSFFTEDKTRIFFPGAPFLLAGGLIVLAMFFVFTGLRINKKQE